MLDSWYLDAIWISVAFIGGLLAKRINLPPLVGFLVAGFALSFSSTVFAIKILEDRGEVNSFHGKLTIGILICYSVLVV